MASPRLADVHVLSDTFTSLADGKLNGQKAFMTGALKVKGNVRTSSTFRLYDKADVI